MSTHVRFDVFEHTEPRENSLGMRRMSHCLKIGLVVFVVLCVTVFSNFVIATDDGGSEPVSSSDGEPKDTVEEIKDDEAKVRFGAGGHGSRGADHAAAAAASAGGGGGGEKERGEDEHDHHDHDHHHDHEEPVDPEIAKDEEAWKRKRKPKPKGQRMLTKKKKTEVKPTLVPDHPDSVELDRADELEARGEDPVHKAAMKCNACKALAYEFELVFKQFDKSVRKGKQRTYSEFVSLMDFICSEKSLQDFGVAVIDGKLTDEYFRGEFFQRITGRHVRIHLNDVCGEMINDYESVLYQRPWEWKTTVDKVCVRGMRLCKDSPAGRYPPLQYRYDHKYEFLDMKHSYEEEMAARPEADAIREATAHAASRLRDNRPKGKDTGSSNNNSSTDKKGSKETGTKATDDGKKKSKTRRQRRRERERTWDAKQKEAAEQAKAWEEAQRAKHAKERKEKEEKEKDAKTTTTETGTGKTESHDRGHGRGQDNVEHVEL